MIRPILVTGASGFLGSHVVTELYNVGLGGRVHLLLRSEPTADSLLGLRFRDHALDIAELKPRLHFADFTDQASFQARLAELKNLSREWIVIHLAAIINPQGDEETQEKVNFDRTIELLEWTNQNGKRFIFTSSIVAFGGTPHSELRDERDYDNYHWLNRLDGYSRSKRKAHDSILKSAQVATVILCPGIIHGAYEHKKSSRAHLETILAGRLRWIPGGIGAFVSLPYVGQRIVQAALSPAFESGIHVKLLNDVCLPYTEYFTLYRDCAKKERIRLHRIPQSLIYIFALLYAITRPLGLKAAKLGKLVQAFLSYNFKTESSHEQGKAALRQALIESFEKRG